MHGADDTSLARTDLPHQAQERLELALKGASLASWDWDIATGKVISNPRCAEMRGFRPDEISHHVDAYLACIHTDDVPAFKRALSDCFEGTRPEFECEYRTFTKSGDWIWILSQGQVFARDELGHPVRMVGTSLDITARKQAQTEDRLLGELGTVFAETLEFEDRLTSLARLLARDLADVCIVDVVEEDSSIRRARVLCRDPAQGWICDALMRTPAHAEKTGQGVLIQKVTPDVIRSWLRADEDPTAFQRAGFRSSITTPLIAHGKALGTVSLLSLSRDYEPSDLRRAESIVQQVALLLDNARLFAASKRAIQARDEILGIVAHDLRNPLAAIATWAMVLSKRGEREIGEEIENAADRMNRLIQDLLDITHIEASRLSLSLVPLSAAEIVSVSANSQTPLATSASLDLRLDLAPNLPEIRANRDRLLQVFENLIGNAIKFTRPGGQITLSAAAHADEVVFSVVDTGIGIESTHLPHVFDRFWQASHEKREGAGLGLAIVKGIVDAHGGRIWVQSSRGQGSTFFFTIPTTAQAMAGRGAVVTDGH